MPVTDARPLRRDAERNRQRILDAARDVFAERGTDATLDDIAAAAGVGVGTVYRRYRNKADLLEELLEEPVNRLVRFAEEAADAADPWQALLQFLTALEELSAHNRALQHVALHSASRETRIARTNASLQPPLETLLARAKSSGKLRDDIDYQDLAMIHRMISAVVDRTDTDDREIWRRYLILIIDGLARRRSAPAPLPSPR